MPFLVAFGVSHALHDRVGTAVIATGLAAMVILLAWKRGRRAAALGLLGATIVLASAAANLPWLFGVVGALPVIVAWRQHAGDASCECAVGHLPNPLELS